MDEVLRQLGPVSLVVLTLSLPVVLAKVIPILLRRPAHWAWERLQLRMDAPAELDPAAQALVTQIRRECLCASLDRIDRLIAHDDWMSATRQMGNRLARRRLVVELRQLPDLVPSARREPWSEAATTQRGWAAFSDGPATPKVEFLEIGLRH